MRVCVCTKSLCIKSVCIKSVCVCVCVCTKGVCIKSMCVCTKRCVHEKCVYKCGQFIMLRKLNYNKNFCVIKIRYFLNTT